MTNKLGKNFSTDTFEKSGDMYPAQKLLVNNLNKMIDHTGKYTWSAYGVQHISKNAEQLSLSKETSSSLELDLLRKGIYVTIRGTFKGKGVFNADTAWTVITIEDAIPDMYNPIAQIATSINTKTTGGSIVFVANGNLYVMAPSDKTNTTTVNIDMIFPSGPALVLKTSKRSKMKMSDHVSTEIINAVWAEFSKSSAKMPSRPGSKGVSTTDATIGELDGILGGKVSANKSQLGTSLTGLITLTSATNASVDTFKISTFSDSSFLPEHSQPIAANITQVWTDTDNTKQTEEWLITDASIDSGGNVSVPIPSSFKDANTNDNATVTLSFNAYW